MDVPTWAQWGFVAVGAALCVMSFRAFRAAWRRTHEEGRRPDDEWDPFA